MKKIIVLIVSCCVMLCLAACGNSDEAAQNFSAESAAAENLNVFVPIDSEEEEIEILFDCTLPEGDTSVRYLIVRNNTNETQNVSVFSQAYDADGSVIASGSSSEVAVGPACTAVLCSTFETEESIDHYESVWSTLPCGVCSSVLETLSYEESRSGSTVEFQVTNCGENAVRYTKGYTLFLKDGEAVDIDISFFMDDEFELKPGETISGQAVSSEDFDSVEFYLTGFGVNW